MASPSHSQRNTISQSVTLDSSIAGIEPDFNPFADSQSALDTRSISSSNSYIPLQTMHTENSARNSTSNRYSTENVNEDDDLIVYSEGPADTERGTLLGNKSAKRAPRGALLHRFRSLFSKSQNSIELPISEPGSAAGNELDENSFRDVYPGMLNDAFPSNFISNAKYNAFSFLPVILYEQFKFFFNLYFLLVALSQAIPALRIGYLSSYVVPLAFVLCVTMSKEALDDIQRRRRDAEQNNELYEVLNSAHLFSSEPRVVQSRNIRVGDLVKIHKGKRIPADMILLQSSEKTGESFIKTDQLDGETDWKLRIAVPSCQNLPEDQLVKIRISAARPNKDIHSFYGNLVLNETHVPLSVDNALWANTVLASGSAVGCVVYTGIETRQSMNTSQPGVKTGLLELEINSLSKVLCASVFVLSVGLVALHGFGSGWYVDIMKYLILFSTIIPVSLRVNLDLGKSVYAYQIEHDKSIENTVVRTSTIPEDLGRIEYLLSDKTGTLTQNDMELKKIHLGTVSYAGDSMDLVKNYVLSDPMDTNATATTSRRDMSQRVYELVHTLALCHNVTPSFEDGEITYQAASPDEIAIVKFTESVGLSLYQRDRTSVTLVQNGKHNVQLRYEILQVFPFNSDTKRMGIIIRDVAKNEYSFLLKGADTVMRKIVVHSVWLDEEVSNMAREGLRTLVVAKKKISQQTYETFKKQYQEASLTLQGREHAMQKCVTQFLERDMELLGLTGVEDKLQMDVKSSIETLRNAGIKIWMLTGDKVETARCVAVSCKLIRRGQYVHTVTRINAHNALGSLEYLKGNKGACLLIDGESLGIFLKEFPEEFLRAVVNLPAVIACRCTPQQKADVALLIRKLTKKRVCCIGDGGNDVNMIQSADVGVGIVGKEGKQASLAADFSVMQFCHLTKLLLWHGRNSYKRSAKLAQFVIHRGLIISICQVVYSVASKFEPLALYQGWLMVGYATCYTMMPVFSMVLDTDVNENVAYLYPELYKELIEGKSLSWTSFFVWCFISTYQGSVIQLFSQYFTSIEAQDFTKMVAVSFTSLIVNELLMVAVGINTWRRTMVITEIVTFIIYFGSVPFLSEYFDLKYVSSLSFVWQTVLIVTVSLLPIWLVKIIYKKLNPPNYAKVQ